MNAHPWSGLVNASANMVFVWQYTNFTSPDAILSFMKKFWMLRGIMNQSHSNGKSQSNSDRNTI